MNITADSATTCSLPGYTFTETLYEGSRTKVYRAVETATRKPVVIKVLSEDYPTFSELVQFRNQYAITQHLPVPGIVRPLNLASYGNGYGLGVVECRMLPQSLASQPFDWLQRLSR